MGDGEERTSRVGGFLLNWPNRILVKDRTKTYTSKMGMKNMIRYQGCGILC